MKRRDRLALRVPPRDEEPAFGLFCRLAARPGFTDARELAVRVGLPFSEIVSGRERRAVEELAGVADGTLAASTVVYGEEEALYGSDAFLKNDWPGTPARVCPACLREGTRAEGPHDSPHRRFWWSWKALDCCPRHSVMLVSHCPDCRRPIEPSRTDLIRCRCGTGLTVEMAVPAAESLVRVDRYLLSRLLGRPHRRLQVLDGIPLRSVLGTMLAVGAPPGIRPGNLVRQLDEVRFEAKASAYRIFRRWPRAFHEKLDHFHGMRIDPDAASAKDRKSPYFLYQHIIGYYTSDRTQSPIRDAYKAHYLLNVPAGLNTRIFQQSMDNSSRLTLSATNVACGLYEGSSKLLPILRDMGVIKASETVHTATCARSLLDVLREALADSLNMGEAIELLGVTTTGMQALIDGGHVEIRQNEYDAAPRVTRVSIEYLIFDLANGHTGPGSADEGLMSIVELARTRVAERIFGLENALASVRRGTTPVVATDPALKGLAGLMVRRADVTTMKKVRAPGVDLKTAARFLRISSIDILYLVRSGLLRTRSGSGTYNSGNHSYVELKAFQSGFGTLKDLGRSVRVSPSDVRRALDKAGILPVAAPPDSRAIFYAMSTDLKKVLSSLRQAKSVAGMGARDTIAPEDRDLPIARSAFDADDTVSPDRRNLPASRNSLDQP